MKNCFLRIAAILVAAMLVLPSISIAEAGRQYIIPDSGVRQLTYSELSKWTHDSLGYILNEIFARHSYNFEPNGAYYNYFKNRPWYMPNTNPDNDAACYPKLSNVEWANEQLIKEVRSDMRDSNNYNINGKNYRDYVDNPWGY